MGKMWGFGTLSGVAACAKAGQNLSRFQLVTEQMYNYNDYSMPVEWLFHAMNICFII